MKYFRIDKLTGETKEITRHKALFLLECGYRNAEELLTIEQTIPLMTCYIKVERGSDHDNT